MKVVQMQGGSSDAEEYSSNENSDTDDADDDVSSENSSSEKSEEEDETYNISNSDDNETSNTTTTSQSSSAFQSKFQQALKAEEQKELDADALRQRKQTALLNCGLGISMILFGGKNGVKTAYLLLRMVSGMALLYSGKLIFQNNNNSNDGGALKGYKVANVVSAVVTWIMGRRHFKCGEPYVPTGVIATVALITLFYNGIDTLVAMSEQREAGSKSNAK